LEVERRSKDVHLYEEVGDADLTCRADAYALEQLFRNILENAIAACVEPGRITIRCQDTSLDATPAIEVAIHDNGPGFEPGVRRKVFEPFFTTRTKGTGLGMAIAHRIAEAHGGRIAVGPDDGTGAEILLTLPR
jgi:signal transduction histidine kinase